MIQFFFGIGVLANALWYYLSYSWNLVLLIYYIVPLFLVILGFVFVVVDTPIGLVMRYTPYEAMRAFQWIARWNGRVFNTCS